jgi:hypothetical protein
MRPAEIRAAKVRPIELDIAEISIMKFGSAEVGLA